mmetsp:Transcript_4027/g.7180  ORF Transcript_4027/g.7180 Transcript_4027/m.7180 type:complete len:97 (+) Transcript_4027:187-477(+)
MAYYIPAPKSLYWFARSLQKYLIVASFLFFEAIVMDLMVQIERATKTSPPTAYCIVSSLQQYQYLILAPPHLYHCFHQSKSLDGEWGVLVQNRQLG